MSFLQLLTLSTLVAIISYDVTRTRIFKAFRVWLTDKFGNTPAKDYLELIKCHYCFSHWVAIVVQLCSRQTVHVTHNWLDVPITWTALIVISQPIMVFVDYTTDAMSKFEAIFIIQRILGRMRFKKDEIACLKRENNEGGPEKDEQ